MTWRDFVEQMKDVGEALVARLRDDRKLSRFCLYMAEADEKPNAVGIPDEHFATDVQIGRLIEMFITPLIVSHGATRVCWLLNTDVLYMRGGGEVTVPECIVLSCFDREVEETWAAPIYRYGDATAIGLWQSWPRNGTSTELVSPIQQAIR